MFRIMFCTEKRKDFQRPRVERYDRSDVLRILRLTARQLAGWEKAGLLPAAHAYSFFDLLQIKKLRDLRAKRVRSAVILESWWMREVAGMENPSMEMGAFASKSRVVFRHQGPRLSRWPANL